MVDQASELDSDIILFVQVREIDEIKKITEIMRSLSIAYPIVFNTLIVSRTQTMRKAYSNRSDADVETINYDYRIENNDTVSGLGKSATEFIEGLIGE